MALPTTTNQKLFSAIGVFLLHFHAAKTATVSSVGSARTDLSALLTFKSALFDPHGALTSWNNGSTDPCNWKGIFCGPQPANRVTALELESLQLEGILSPSISNITYLRELHLPDNLFHGSIPEELGKLTWLEDIDLTNNSFEGDIPFSFASHPVLERLLLGNNNLAGVIPPLLGNSSSLTFVILSSNHLSGIVPQILVNNSGLKYLDLSNNELTGGIPVSVETCSSLINLDLSFNNLVGSIPPLLGTGTNLCIIDLSSNNLSQNIPRPLMNSSSLYSLSLAKNGLTGEIPPFVSSSLTFLDLSGNKLTGQIPSSIGNLNELNGLYLQDNVFSGRIPPTFGMYWIPLRELNLSNNAFNGRIPKKIVSLSSLTRYLDLSHNSFSGTLPMEIGTLKILMALNVSYNQLSGQIPAALGSCIALQHLNMEMNFFQGTIPKEFINLNAIIELDLSHNNLFGQIPNFFEGFSDLRLLNLSYNNLNGEVPEDGIFSNFSAVSLTGNLNLCGGNSKLHLQSCSGEETSSKKLKIIVPIASAAFLIILLCTFYIIYRSKRSSSTVPLAHPQPLVTYAEIHNATNGFSAANFIGSGSFGRVYKGKMLQGGNVFAIKVINLNQQGAMRSFITECQALRYIRHRNLLKVVTVCSSLDYNGNEFKAFVFPYMPNGSLQRWLHLETEDKFSKSSRLSLYERLKIAIDVASALEYLHHNCVPPIVHCDLKPSNVLLDDNMTAVVCDVGIATIISTDFSDASFNSTSLISLRGTFGYVAPEYGMGSQISWQGDVYSYGVLLLEILTGKSPTDDSFIDGLNLHKHVLKAFPETITAVLDPQILREVEDEANTDRSFGARMKECVVSLFRIGLTCSSESPRERMDMIVVVQELNSLRKIFYEAL